MIGSHSPAHATGVLAATEARDPRSRLQRETEVACVAAAAIDAATNAWGRGDATLRACMREALTTLRAG